MIKKMLLLLTIMSVVAVSYASRLSHHINKIDNDNRLREEQQWRRDMNFSDFSFRLVKNYVDGRGQRCRDYMFRARSNPFQHGFYTVCDER